MLNRIQSIVQPTAMNTNENMLICGAYILITVYTELS
jgi:antiviral helicase SLH1